MMTIDSLLNLVKSEAYQKQVISLAVLPGNVNYPVNTVHNGLISASLRMMLLG